MSVWLIARAAVDGLGGVAAGTVSTPAGTVSPARSRRSSPRTLSAGCSRRCRGSVPGPGRGILAEIGDGSRFETGDRLAAYAGLALAKRQSGKILNADAKSRRGNHRLKNAIFLAAFASLRSPESKAFTTANVPRGNGTTPP